MAMLLAVMLVVTMLPAAASAEGEPSEYSFEYTVPEKIAAGKDVNVDVTFKTVEEKDYGYEGVRFAFKAEGPGNVTFKAKDSLGAEHTFTNEGCWGPDKGFDLPADYEATTNWTLNFSRSGKYTITFSLIDADSKEVIDGIEDSATVTVVDAAVIDASRIYADDDEYDADGKDEVTLTIYLRDSTGKPTSELGTGKALYVWAERREDVISSIDVYRSVSGGEKLGYEEKSLVAIAPASDMVNVKYTSNFDGDVRFYFGIDNYPDYSGEDTPEKGSYVEVEFVEDTREYKMVLVGDRDQFVGSNSEAADGISSHVVEIMVMGRHGFPLRGERVNFDTSSSRLHLNKDWAVTNSAGIVEVKATSERVGKYTLYVELGSNRRVDLYDEDGKVLDGVELEYRASAAYNIKVKKGDGAVVALDEDYTFEFEVYDIFGRIIKGGDYRGKNRLIDSITVAECPDKARIEDIDDFLEDDIDAVSWDSNANLKVEVDGRYLNKEGDYAIRVRLNSGKYATANFEVKEQGKIVDMTIEYDPDYIGENETTDVPEVKIIDKDGIEADAPRRDLEFSVSNTRLARIDDEGRVTARRDAEGVVVVTAVNTRHNVVATTEVRIGDVGAAGIKFDVPKVLLVDEEYTIGMKVVDEDGREYLKDAEYNVVVISKPSGADVEVDVLDDEFTIISDTKGDVRLIATAREDDEAISSTLTLEFVTVPEDDGAGDVFLTIGGTFAYVNGSPVGLDAPAFIDQGRTYVPVRFLAEAFGAEADWTPKNGPVETVYLTRDDMEITIGIGDEYLIVTLDDEAEVVTFDGAAQIRHGRTFLPFRAIAEAFGAEVDYGPKTGKVEWVSFKQKAE
jgi:hypothetical protein